HFFFQAEDGIRDLIVTGVQTCALPISIFSVIDNILMEPFPYPDANGTFPSKSMTRNGVNQAGERAIPGRSFWITWNRIMCLTERLRMTRRTCCTGLERGQSASTETS